MPKQEQPHANEQFADMAFPVKGVDIARGFGMQQPGTTQLGVNVRTFEPETDRSRGGSRPGLAKFILGQVPAGAHLIQHLNFVIDPAAEALLDNIDYPPGTVTIPDPTEADDRNPGGRLVRVGGTGIQPNRNSLQGLKIVWSNPADIDEGTALDGTQLNAAALDSKTDAPVAGAYTYNPNFGTVLMGGKQQTLTVTFVPSNLTKYRATTKKVKINVFMTPLITWADPANIGSGVALSSTQLNAVAKDPDTMATVPGIYTYTPPSGTILPDGTGQPLRVDFAPTDTLLYRVANKTVHINVGAGIVLVQATSDSQLYPPHSTIKFTSNVTAGSLLVAVIFDWGDTNTLTVTDSLGQTWTNAINNVVPRATFPVEGDSASGAYRVVSIWYKANTLAGACTLTILPTNPSDGLGGQLRPVIVSEYWGAKTTAPLTFTDSDEGVVAHTGSATPVIHSDAVLPPLTINSAGDLIVAGMMYMDTLEDEFPNSPTPKPPLLPVTPYVNLFPLSTQLRNGSAAPVADPPGQMNGSSLQTTASYHIASATEGTTFTVTVPATAGTFASSYHYLWVVAGACFKHG